MAREIFNYGRFDTEKLEKYGFKKPDGAYEYQAPVADGKFTLFISVAENGEIDTKTIDNDTGDEYILHLVEDSAGEFVGKVRSEYNKILEDIKTNCFEKEFFSGKQSKELIEYVRAKYGDELEFLWEKSPDAIWRRRDNGKWYGALLTVKKDRLGLDGGGTAEIIDLRAEPELIDEITDGKRFFRGYHMNKRHWFTIVLDYGVPTETICNYIDNSYLLALRRKDSSASSE